MKEKKKRQLNMRITLLRFALVPLIVAIASLGVGAYILITSGLESQTKQTLFVASNGLKNYYEKIYNEKGSIMYETTYVDSMKSQEVELTLFMNNVRYATSIKNDQGARIEGTNASDAVWNAVKAGNDYYSDGVKINNKDYYVYYLPLLDKDGNIFGMAFAGKTCDDVKATQNKLALMIAIIGIVLLGIFIPVAIIMANMIVKPLKRVADNIDTMSTGILETDNNISANIAETNTLIESSTSLQSNLKDIIGKTKDATEVITKDVSDVTGVVAESADSTRQIATAMSELADGATLLATNVQDINSRIMDMGSLIGDITDNVTTLSDSANAMDKANVEATGYIDRMADSSEKSVKAVQDIATQVKDTNEAIVSINDAVTLITDIASQTNLLALNASIEAARAGEQGKGFAVVADEIKKLAEQSNDSAEDIRRIVEEILVKSERSVDLSKTVEDIIVEEQELLSETKNKFDLLNTEINSSVNEISSISSKTLSLDEIKAVITSSVSDLSAISEENSASNEEISASIDTIAENMENISKNMNTIDGLSKDLAEAVSFFK